MKTMSLSLIQLSLLAVFALVGTTALTSCQNGGCTVLESDNYDPDAKKDDDSCIPWRNKFIGTYAATETCTNEGPASFTLTVTPSSNSEQGIILSYAGVTFSATVTGRNTLDIPTQQINIDGNAFTLSGTGTISEETELLRFTYILSFGVLSTNCTMEGTKL